MKLQTKTDFDSIMVFTFDIGNSSGSLNGHSLSYFTSQPFIQMGMRDVVERRVEWDRVSSRGRGWLAKLAGVSPRMKYCWSSMKSLFARRSETNFRSGRMVWTPKHSRVGCNVHQGWMSERYVEGLLGACNQQPSSPAKLNLLVSHT